ncbi:TPA: hypothetical protein QCS34_006638, partial [Bacillus thuringiensis]|nr:hypothetical protein [Bacillus thuringiensis]
IGNLLQSIGNSLQAIGGIEELKSIRNENRSNIEGNVNDVEKDIDTQVNKKTNENEEGKLIDIIGSWVQAVGSVISLIGQIREESEELEGSDE